MSKLKYLTLGGHASKCLSKFFKLQKVPQLEVVRFLFSDADIRLEGYLRQRIFMIDSLDSDRKRTMACKLKEIQTPTEAKLAAFQVVDFMHIVQTPQEVVELERLFRLISQTDLIGLESFSFGSSLLRMYHHLELPKQAYQLYRDPVCSPLFTDMTCRKILMNLLYKHQHYELVLDVMGDLQAFNHDCVTLAFAAYYQINTPQSFKSACDMYKAFSNQIFTSKRLHQYLAMLSLNQGHPDVAMEIVGKCPKNNILFNLKLLCQAKLGLVQEILADMEEAYSLSKDNSKPLQVRLYADTVREVQLSVTASNSSVYRNKLKLLEKKLSNMGAMSQLTLVSMIDRTIYGEQSQLKVKGKKQILPEQLASL